MEWRSAPVLSLTSHLRLCMASQAAVELLPSVASCLRAARPLGRRPAAQRSDTARNSAGFQSADRFTSIWHRRDYAASTGDKVLVAGKGGTARGAGPQGEAAKLQPRQVHRPFEAGQVRHPGAAGVSTSSTANSFAPTGSPGAFPSTASWPVRGRSSQYRRCGLGEPPLKSGHPVQDHYS